MTRTRLRSVCWLAISASVLANALWPASPAGAQPIRTIADFYLVLDSIPPGGTLRLEGRDAYYNLGRRYSATAPLD